MSEDNRTYYCLCEDNCKFETMTKEQILSAINQALRTGDVSDINDGFISKVKELYANRNLTFQVLTQQQYNMLTDEDLITNCLYIITDDTSLEGINEQLDSIRSTINNMQSTINDSGWKDVDMEPSFGPYENNSDNKLRYRIINGIVEIRGIITPISDISDTTQGIKIGRIDSYSVSYERDPDNMNNTIEVYNYTYAPRYCDIVHIARGSGYNIWTLRIEHGTGWIYLSRYNTGGTNNTLTAGSYLPINVTYTEN